MSSPRSWYGVAAPAPPRQYRRLAMLTAMIALAFVGLAARLVDIQWAQAEDLRARAEAMRVRKHVFTPLRGSIMDRHQTVLAQSILVKTVKADPSLVGPEYAGFLARHLAGPLQLDPGHLACLLASDRRTNDLGEVVKDRYALLKKGVTREEWRRVESVLANLEVGQNDRSLPAEERRRRRALKRRLAGSITCEAIDEQVRLYPKGTVAAQVLGFVGHQDRPEGYGTTVGAEGLEYALNSVLQGVWGWQVREEVRRGGTRFDQLAESYRARPGLNVVLTLDARLQVIAERVLAEGFRQHRPAGISCVVVVPQTGEILAMANLPNFDPNRYGESTPQGRRNRAITDAYEPGSTFKALSIASALEAGVITLAHRVDCEQGAYRYRHRVLHDLHPYGTLDIISVIAKSSNIGAAKIGQALGEADLYAGLKRFGIGDPTGIPLPAESPGLLRPLERWVKHDSILSIPMGHEVMATPLQMTMAMAAIANQGRLMRPLLVRQVVKESGEVVAQCGPQVRRQAISAAVAQQMTQALTAVVDGEGGTGPQARLEAYSVAGKTGTAEKWKNGRPSDGHFASFIGFFPAEAPRLCIGVFVDEPRGGTHFGGTTAAPLFREIATQAAAYLGIPSSPSKVEPIRAAELAQGTGRSRLTPGTGRARM